MAELTKLPDKKAVIIKQLIKQREEALSNYANASIDEKHFRRKLIMTSGSKEVQTNLADSTTKMKIFMEVADICEELMKEHGAETIL